MKNYCRLERLDPEPAGLLRQLLLRHSVLHRIRRSLSIHESRHFRPPRAKVCSELLWKCRYDCCSEPSGYSENQSPWIACSFLQLYLEHLEFIWTTKKETKQNRKNRIYYENKKKQKKQLTIKKKNIPIFFLFKKKLQKLLLFIR